MCHRGRAREPLLKMAKLGAVVDDGWPRPIAPSALCSAGLRSKSLRVVPCTVMSMIERAPDVQRLRGGYLRFIACTPCNWPRNPSALLDWNNNYGEDPTKAVCFHCSNLPKHFFKEARMDFQQISPAPWAATTPTERAWAREIGPHEFSPRFSTNDRQGSIHGYVGDSEFHRRPARNLGGPACAHPQVAELLRSSAARLRTSRGRHLGGSRGRAGSRHALSRLEVYQIRRGQGQGQVREDNSLVSRPRPPPPGGP